MPADLTFHNDSFNQGNEPRLQDILNAIQKLDTRISFRIISIENKLIEKIHMLEAKLDLKR